MMYNSVGIEYLQLQEYDQSNQCFRYALQMIQILVDHYVDKITNDKKQNEVKDE
jgi:hypothetical protein